MADAIPIPTHPQFQDLTGQRFGFLTVLSYAGQDSGRRSRWLCRCQCGTEKTVIGKELRRGKTVSCGCYRKQTFPGNRRKHGRCRSREYIIYHNMLKRCTDSSCRHYVNYGGRGITVCERWRGEGGFERFIADMGEPLSAKHTIDRIDNNGHYEPGNCRWATNGEQQRNKRTNRTIEHNGRCQTLQDWAEELGVDQRIISQRLDKLGWSIRDALTKPTRPLRRHKPATQ